MSNVVKIYNQQAETVGEIELSPKIFGVKANEALVHQAVVAQMANQRQVLAHTKDRGEVRGGGKKPWKQKGTGRARAGSSRSPIWIGGGITFGPRKDRNFKKDVNKKMKSKAIFMALSDKVKHGSLIILDKIEMAEYKTKLFNQVVRALEEKVLNIRQLDSKTTRQPDDKKTKRQGKRSLLIINEKKDDKVKNSGRNLVGVALINLDNINLVDLLKYKNLIMTKAAVEKLEERYK